MQTSDSQDSRVLISLVFLFNSIGFFFDPDPFLGLFSSIYSANYRLYSDTFGMPMPQPDTIHPYEPVLILVLEVVMAAGAIMTILGKRSGPKLLISLVAVVTVFGHNPWMWNRGWTEGMSEVGKNLAVIGGLLVLDKDEVAIPIPGAKKPARIQAVIRAGQGKQKAE